MWKKKVNTVLAKHAGTRQNGAAASARTMAHTGQVVYKAFSRLHEMGLKIEDPQNLSDKHIRALVRDWWLGPKRKAPKTIQNDLSRLRMFAGWIGKPNLVLTTIKYLGSPAMVCGHSMRKTPRSMNRLFQRPWAALQPQNRTRNCSSENCKSAKTSAIAGPMLQGATTARTAEKRRT